MKEEQLTFWSEEHHVNRSVLQDSEEASMTSEEISRSLIAEWLIGSGLAGSSGKMSLVSCRVTEEGTFLPSSQRWLNSGIASPGECWTLKTLESPKDADECLLSDVLLEIGEIHPRYYLSSRAAIGILRRAEKRGKKLPDHIFRALQEVSIRNAEEGS
jgi:hypothetical protein